MTEKIPFQNKIIAFLLSIILIGSIFLSFFALPTELILFNPQSFSGVLQDEAYIGVLPDVLAETLVFEASLSSQTNQIDLIANQATISNIISDKIPDEIVQDTYDKVLSQTFSYLNFKIPTSDMTLNIAELKAAMVENSPEIASEFLATLPNCSEADLAGFDATAELKLSNLPKCKPSDKNLDTFEAVWGMAFEDMFNSMPSTVSLGTIIPIGQILTDQNFYYYSLIRWAFRLLPIISILLMILMAVLLRKQRGVMWKWMGRLLVVVSAITLIGLVVLLIGFDQFIAMLLNPFLKNWVAGFGFLLLSAVQDVGYNILIWVIITALAVMGFGILLLLIGRRARPQAAYAGSEPQIEEPAAVNEPEEMPAKTVVPETMDEVEENEKKLNEEKKDEG